MSSEIHAKLIKVSDFFYFYELIFSFDKRKHLEGIMSSS